MGAIGIVPKIVFPVVRVRIIGHALPDPKLYVPFEEIKIVMGVESKIIP